MALSVNGMHQKEIAILQQVLGSDATMNEPTMVKLNNLLVKASDEYYNTGNSIMSDKQYDTLFDILGLMEKVLGKKLPNSVTQNVGASVSTSADVKNQKVTSVGGYEVVSALLSEAHEEKALSLDKTKDRNALNSWLGTQKGCLSWKCDGLTTVLTYDNGYFVKAVTRGNGEVGKVVTHMAKHIVGIPMTINYKGHLVLRGETVMTYDAFNRANVNGEFKNARNLASGTLQSLDSNILKTRQLNFKAFELVKADGNLPSNSFYDNLEWLGSLGFEVVEHYKVEPNKVVEAIEFMSKKLPNLDFPTDGLVLQMDDIAYGKSLGMTGKFPRNGMAFKWKDETAETTIKQFIWQVGRTGTINPVAVFEPVELEGSTVQRATCNNISFMQKLNLCVGSRVTVYKANMIIPTIDDNLTKDKGDFRNSIPSQCPCCGAKTEVVQTKEALVLYCPNAECSAKNIKSLVHYVGRDAMDIMGVAESTIDMLNQNGYLKTPCDFYTLYLHPEIANLPNFGKESYTNLIKSVEASKKTTLAKFIYAWGIEQIGKQVAKDIAKHCKDDVVNFINAMNNRYDWRQIDGFGDVMLEKIYAWWSNSVNRVNFEKIASILQFEKSAVTVTNTNSGIAGKTFCVTGSVNIFPNRNAVGAYIEQRGGKLASSVTSKTDYLVTNDTTSGSSKNKKAQELGKPILTEQQLIDLGGGL